MTATRRLHSAFGDSTIAECDIGHRPPRPISIRFSPNGGETMDPSLVAAFKKLIILAEQVGLGVDQLLNLLENGATVGMLINLIELRLSPPKPSASCWIL